MFVDTHAHLWWESYRSDLAQVVERAQQAQVHKIIVPGTNLLSSKKAIQLSQEYPGTIYPAIGIHPEDTDGADLGELRKLLLSHRGSIVAIGEIGTDLYTPDAQATLPTQIQLFRDQLLLALEFDLPVIIHTRDSFEHTWSVLSSLPRMPRGQFHCFSVDEAALKQVLEAGFYVSFCGNIAWSKRVARLVPLVPLNRLLLETDSPFMAPKERNEPATVVKLAELIAQMHHTSLSELEKITTESAKNLYQL